MTPRVPHRSEPRKQPMPDRFQPLEFQTPLFEKNRPVFPDTPLRPTPYILHNLKNWKWQVVVRDLTLQYLVSGHIAYEIDGSIYEAARGTCFLFRPGLRLSGRTLDGKPVTMFAAHFVRIPESETTNGQIRTPIREISLFEETARYAVKCRQRTDARARKNTETALLQLFHLFEDNLARGPVSAVQLRIEELIETIKREPGRDWRVEVMCDQTQLSRSQLTRWFNRMVGTSPNRFVIEHRIAHAVCLLGMSNSSVAEIADMLGYSDVQFFVRQFKKETGIPPGSMRKG